MTRPARTLAEVFATEDAPPPAPRHARLSLSLPTPLATLYTATPGLPLPSHLLATAMRAALLEAGIPPDDPALAPPPPTRTHAATLARAARRREQPGRSAPGPPRGVKIDTTVSIQETLLGPRPRETPCF